MRFASLSKRLRSRGALAAAALYAFCVLAPHAAVALGSEGHCLTDDHQAAHVHKAKADVTAHTHADGTVHHHGGNFAAHDDTNATDPHQDSRPNDKGGNCCGLFCISAMAAEPGPLLLASLSFTAHLPALADALRGRNPGRLNRPPIR
jgi:hypothetical protein